MIRMLDLLTYQEKICRCGCRADEYRKLCLKRDEIRIQPITYLRLGGKYERILKNTSYQEKEKKKKNISYNTLYL